MPRPGWSKPTTRIFGFVGAEDLELEPTQRPWWHLTEGHIFPLPTASHFDKWRFRTVTLSCIQFAAAWLHFLLVVTLDPLFKGEIDKEFGQWSYMFFIISAIYISCIMALFVSFMMPNNGCVIPLLVLAVVQLIPAVRFFLQGIEITKILGLTFIGLASILQLCPALLNFVQIVSWYIRCYVTPKTRPIQLPTGVDENPVVEPYDGGYLSLAYQEQLAELDGAALFSEQLEFDNIGPVSDDNAQIPYRDDPEELAPHSTNESQTSGQVNGEGPSNLHPQASSHQELPPFLQSLFNVASRTNHRYDDFLGTLATFSEQRGSAILSAVISESTEQLERLLRLYPPEVRQKLSSLSPEAAYDLRTQFLNIGVEFVEDEQNGTQEASWYRPTRSLSFRPRFRWEDRLPEDLMQYFVLLTIAIVILFSGFHSLYIYGKGCFGKLKLETMDMIPLGAPALSLLSLPVLAMPLRRRGSLYVWLAILVSLCAVIYWVAAIALSIFDWVQEPALHASQLFRICKANYAVQCCQVYCAECLLVKILAHVLQSALLLAIVVLWCYPCLANALQIRIGLRSYQRLLLLSQ